MKKLFTLFLVFTLGISFAMADNGGKSCGNKTKKSCSASAKTATRTVDKSKCDSLKEKCSSDKSKCDTKAVQKTGKKEKKQSSESAPI